MARRGWYGRLVSPASSTQSTQWVVIDNFWLETYNQRSDSIPALMFHLSDMEFSDGYADTGQLHSLKLTPGHPCNYRFFCLYTPNQFDIAAIKAAILSEQEKWWALSTSTHPDVPQTYTADLSRRFIYKPADRLQVTIKNTSISVQQPNQDEIFLLIDPHFDVHPTLDRDVRWVQIGCWANGVLQSLRLHFAEVGDTRKAVTTMLHCKVRCLAQSDV
jgi:hypothetical protein